MPLESDSVVQVLLRERLRVASAAAAVLRDAHAADDVFQQVVLAALESRHEFRGSDHVFAWAMRTARSRAIDIARRRRMMILPDDILDRLEDCHGLEAGSSDRVEAFRRCLGKLPVRRGN